MVFHITMICNSQVCLESGICILFQKGTFTYWSWSDGMVPRNLHMCPGTYTLSICCHTQMVVVTKPCDKKLVGFSVKVVVFFVVHVLLLTHEFIYNIICLPHSWYPQCDRSMFLTCPPKLTDDSPSLIYCGRLVLADA